MILEIIKDLEIELSNLTFSGIDNIDFDFIENLISIRDRFDKLKMNNAKILTNDLIDSIKDYKTNKDIKKVSENISKLEFYLSYALFYLKPTQDKIQMHFLVYIADKNRLFIQIRQQFALAYVQIAIKMQTAY